MDALVNITYDEIKLGDSATYRKTLTEKDLILFAAVSGDVNPVHLDAEFAATSMFKERIAHGMWSGSLISAALATVIPGPGTIYLGQSLRFRRPVKLGDTLTVTLTAKEKQDEKKIVVFDCNVVNQDGKDVVTGTAEVIAPSEKVNLRAPVLPEIRIAGIDN
ncbi:MAG: MaoC family dehydratase N-terminal domain-containing protein [Oceanospirillaceae bacterium]|nr:MaoC family dehydratase N-terminal domain-containing protein [Oceanospirillaceae bacterium]